MASVLFFSDVHLSVEEPARTRLFHRFLEEVAPAADRVVCLGDLFDFWLGPRHADRPDFAETFEALRRLRRRGVPVDFVPGNRDFQVGREFERGLTIPVHGDGIDLALDGLAVHGCHGDLLLTGDRRYQVYRQVVRSAPVRALSDAIPFGVTWRIATWMRSASRREVAAKTPRELAISTRALGALVAAGADVVICGHVHRVGRLEVEGRGRRGQVYTLGDWQGLGRYLWYESGRFEFREIG